MNRTALFTSVVLASTLLSPSAHAQKRVALVIGNAAYAKVGALPNPGRDAGAIESLFRAAGFDVVEAKRDLGVAQMRRTLSNFSDQARDADIAVVFYAGHGIEVNGANYLIPVDAALDRDIDVEDETVALERVTQVIEQAKRLKLVILDACRDNPFVRSMRRTLAGRSIGRGLAKVDILTSDTLIAFAAKAGSTASDGQGLNSPYTTALINHLTTPGVDLRLTLGRVRDEVLKATANRQEPFVYGSLGGAEIALVSGGDKPPQGGVPQQRAPDTASEAAQAWDRTKETTNVGILETFISRYKNTFYADLARARLEELKQRQSSAATPPSVQPPIAESAEKAAWDRAHDSKNPELLRRFIAQFPSSRYKSSALFWLGLLTAYGEQGLPLDYAQARRWYRQAADLGHVGALVNLGILYETGRGGPADYAEARRLFTAAAQSPAATEEGKRKANAGLARLRR
jgi:caspase domain-containing protein/Sel1 repeat-containing protein